MRIRRMIAVAACVGAVGLTGCSTMKKLARGGTITTNDLVNEYDKHEQEKEQARELEKRIDGELAEIQAKRESGNFSSAEYREQSLQRMLEQLKKLDDESPQLTAAPKKLEEIKKTYTKEVYERKALAEECSKAIESSKTARAEDRWSDVDYALERFVKARRKLVDAKGDPAVVKQLDAGAVGEWELFAANALKQTKAWRMEQSFWNAVGMEKNLAKKAEGLAEAEQNAAGNTAKTDKILADMKAIQMAHRDPKEIEAEQAKGAFEAWVKNATEIFQKEWAVVAAAEAAARPTYQAGVAALEAGDYAGALTKLHEARQALFEKAWPSSVALEAAVNQGDVNNGLSYEIAAAIARVHFEKGDTAALYPELAIIKEGRKWGTPEQELQVRLYNILADRNGRLAPQATDLVKRYASSYSNEAKPWRNAREAAEAAEGEAYNMLGVALKTVSHRHAASEPDKNAGAVVFIDEKVTEVAGNKLRFDFRQSYQVPTNCWRTGRISSVNIYTGRVYYEQKCNYKTVKEGYFLVVDKPKGATVKKGDKVSFYATVGKKTGSNLNLDNAGFIRVAPEGKTTWFLGVKVK